MEKHNQRVQEFIDEFTNYLRVKDYPTAIRVFNDKQHQECLKNCSWDLIPVLCRYVNEETSSSNKELSSCCEILLLKLAAEANPEEAILEFLDQLDEADREKFKVILNSLKILLSRDIANRLRSIEWTLNSIRSYSEKYSYDAIPEFFDVEDKEENYLNPQKVNEIENVMNSIISFYAHFVEEINVDSEKELNSLLCSRVIQMFDIFLPYVNVELIPQFKSLQWELTDLLLRLLSNPMSLLEFVFYRALNVMKSKPMEFCNTSKKPNLNNLREVDSFTCDTVENFNPFEDEIFISNLAYGMFFYSLLNETQNEQIKIPMVYNPKYIMLSLIYVTIPFFEKNDIAIYNGLKFLNLLLHQLNDSLTKSDLYFSSHKSLLVHLNNVMVFSQAEKNRKLALTCFKKYIESFNWEGRYLLLVNFRPYVNHSGTLGFLIGLLKNFVSTFLELPQNSQVYHRYIKYYKGKLLYDIIKKYCFLTNGSDTDLVENADHVISSLNALRYLVLRDKKNLTGVKQFIKKVQADFLKPLKENVTSSKKYYELKLKDLQNDESKTSISSSSSDVEVELSVKGQTLPKLTKDQQITAYYSCLNAVDLIDSLLSRLLECINSSYPFSH